MIPLVGTILFYVMLQQGSWGAGAIALAVSLPLMIVVYRAEAQMMPAMPRFISFAVAAFAVAVISIFALIFYELWGIYAYELGGGLGADGQTYWQFALESLGTATVWSDYMDEFIWGLLASIIGIIASYVWVVNSEKA